MVGDEDRLGSVIGKEPDGTIRTRPARPVWKDLFKDPTEVLFYCDPDVMDGKMEVWEWQRKEHLDFMKEYQIKEGDKWVNHQNDMNLKAANGSGKSKMVLAPCAFFTLFWENSRTVITSSSGTQLDNQTGKYIKMLAAEFNKKMGQELIEIKYRSLVFKETGSDILLFATDESGRAEGWHQLKVDSPFTLFFDEGKSIDDGIYVAASRCHDAQRFYKLSSPGAPSGGFFNTCMSDYSRTVTITAYQCPHISRTQINKVIADYGMESPITQSIIFAKFASAEGCIFIDFNKFDKAIKFPCKAFDDGIWRAGADVAAGGDECVLSLWKGNKETKLDCFKEVDTRKTVYRIDRVLNEHGVPKDPDQFQFSLDDNGVGKGIYDGLVELGWPVIRVTTHHKPRNPRFYKNRGAEIYDKFSKFVNSHLLIFIDDQARREQLINRTYRVLGDRMELEDKRKKKSTNISYRSPDRADATVTAWSQTNEFVFRAAITKFNRTFRRLKTDAAERKEEQIRNYKTKRLQDNNKLLFDKGRKTRQGLFRPRLTTLDAYEEIFNKKRNRQKQGGITSAHNFIKTHK